ncbi:tryptophan halogenase family protein [Massilia yuzhufengensis]|uniref:Tryptophan halogenase n=1 Tax=Massilia yuzhufengensis TaxID=1164594 RepID=A0A1I1DMF2_9BURK|nr:tryptophan halogenase family protein [Massilia yuzhufengensis]SFB76165.1 Tryptophan halogenase [Massilia yuzhufengensis]
MVSSAIRHVVIVGGGSAGWLTAAVLASSLETQERGGARVTLVESPDVPTIGVGEGTWPTMRDTLRAAGLSESAFFRECDAAFKQGSRFNGWVTGAADDVYFHPFVLPQGWGDADLAGRWLERHSHVPFADMASYQPHLCVQGRAPKQAMTPEFAAVANYGYHLDAGKFGSFLKKHCLEQLGVHFVPDHVTGIASHDNGDIAALHTKAHGALAGDLFVDCSGMQSLLLGQHYGVPFLSQRGVLFNDSALAVQVPYANEHDPIASQTSSTAQAAGWIWDIGLPARRGIGHVYSSAHTSDEQAELALRAYIRATGGPGDIPPPRKLSFHPGYREQFWHRNCVAIGLSAGFIEPLEASALAMVELSAAMLADEMPVTRAQMDISARRFNETFTYRWERVIDFLKLHYVLSRREDSDYWRDNRRSETIPQRLADMLALWTHRPPSRHDFSRIQEVFPAASYQYILYGMGFRPEPGLARRPRVGESDGDTADGFFRQAADLTRRMLPALPDNRALIAHIVRHGLPKH